MRKSITTALIYFVLGMSAVIAAQTEYSWTVPAGAEKINVKSVRDGETVLNYTFKVEPGQTFKVEVVK